MLFDEGAIGSVTQCDGVGQQRRFGVCLGEGIIDPHTLGGAPPVDEDRLVPHPPQHLDEGVSLQIAADVRIEGQGQDADLHRLGACGALGGWRRRESCGVLGAQ